MPWLALTLNGIHAIVIILKENVLFLASLFSLALLRLAYLLVTKSSPRKKRDKDEKCHIAIFLGSGGHTTEMLQLIGFLPPERYCCRTYITTEGDSFSRGKAMEREKSFSAQLAGSDKSHQRIAIISLPRARKVHQTWLSTPLSVIVTFVYSAYHVIITPRTSRKTASGLFADLIIMNGPGSCVPLVMAVYVLRFCGLRSPRLMYVESFARVRSLSLTGKILRFFVDKFIVQWNENVVRGAHFQGWLI